MPKIKKKSMSGVRFPEPTLVSSFKTKIMNIRTELAINSEKNCPVLVMNG